MSSEAADPAIRRSPESVPPLPRYLLGLGVVLAAALAVELLVGASDLYPFGSVLPARVLTSVPFVAGILYAGYWMGRDGVSPDRYARIGLWCVGATAAFLAINLAVMASVPPANVLVAAGWLRWTVTVGVGLGLLVGTVEARAIDRAVLAEHARVQFDRETDRAELLSYVRDLLSAEVAPLAAAVAEDVADSDRASPELGRNAAALETAADTATALLDSADGAVGASPMNLTAALSAAIDDLRAEDGVDVDVSVPEHDVFVLADGLLPRALSGVLAAVVAREGVTTAGVAVETDGDAVVLRVTADGPPLDADGTPFDPGDGRSFDAPPGGAMAGVLVDYYGGRIDLVESAADGTTVAIELRRVAVAGTRAGSADGGASAS